MTTPAERRCDYTLPHPGHTPRLRFCRACRLVDSHDADRDKYGYGVRGARPATLWWYADSFPASTIGMLMIDRSEAQSRGWLTPDWLRGLRVDSLWPG